MVEKHSTKQTTGKGPICVTPARWQTRSCQNSLPFPGQVDSYPGTKTDLREGNKSTIDTKSNAEEQKETNAQQE